MPPSGFSNGAGSNSNHKYPAAGLLGFPPFLPTPYVFPQIPPLERPNQSNTPSSCHDESPAAAAAASASETESAAASVDFEKGAETWNPLVKIKTENNQNDVQSPDEQQPNDADK